MQNFEEHCQTMLTIVKRYATEQGIIDQMSGLLIFREVGQPEQLPDGKPRMVLLGEDAPIALVTVHQAAKVLTDKLQAPEPTGQRA